MKLKYAIATLIIALIPPLFSYPILRQIRLRFGTVSPQGPLKEYGSDIAFFIVVSVFLLLPWGMALGNHFKKTKDCLAVIPFTALGAVWLLNRQHQQTLEVPTFWITYIGYYIAVLGFAGFEQPVKRWQHLVWLPPMFFLMMSCLTKWWWDVFFE